METITHFDIIPCKCSIVVIEVGSNPKVKNHLKVLEDIRRTLEE
jgi:hypothetical protein